VRRKTTEHFIGVEEVLLIIFTWDDIDPRFPLAQEIAPDAGLELNKFVYIASVTATGWD
jgi:hypothetical protein